MPFGFGGGRGRGRGGGGGGRGMGGGGRGRFLSEKNNFCICPNCKTVVPHQLGVPCYQTICPNCGTPMTRQFQSGLQNAGPVPTAAPMAQIPNVDAEMCTGCRKCLNVCPVNAIKMVDNNAVIDANQCSGCLVCIPACPFGAIKVGENG
ncbi:MAG: 4Fe-4S dicluster domain-containing protein [Calditrichaeota bacterium]|nr:4Fe-4S dicluster domain-containing protein [Calditrichota bacterium]